MFSFLKSIVERVVFNLYSYSGYLVIGILVFLLFEKVLSCKHKFLNSCTSYFTLIILASFLPFCNCIAISYLLYNRSEREKILLYILATFCKPANLILVYAYFGIVAFIFYVLLLVVYILVYLLLNKNKNTTDLESDDTTKTMLRFVFIYFVATIIMSIVEVIVPSKLILASLSNLQNFNIINVIILSIVRYSCMPSDLTSIASLIASGLSSKYLFILIYFAVTVNISELIVLCVFAKNIKYLLISNVLISALGFVILSIAPNGIIGIEYDLSRIETSIAFASIFNISLSSIVRQISSLAIVILSFIYIINLYKNNIFKSK